MSKKEEGLIDPENVASIFLAEVIGITSRAVSALQSEGVIRNNGKRGKYRLTEAVPQYISTLRKSSAGEARARKELEQERRLRIANDAAEGRLVPIADAAEVFRSYCLAWRAGANALPRRVANQFANETNPAVIQQALNDEFAELFAGMENGLIEYFAEYGQAFAVTEAGATGEDATPAKKSRSVGRRKPSSTNRKRRAGKVAK